jgi:hypothetical protein
MLAGRALSSTLELKVIYIIYLSSLRLFVPPIVYVQFNYEQFPISLNQTKSQHSSVCKHSGYCPCLVSHDHSRAMSIRAAAQSRNLQHQDEPFRQLPRKHTDFRKTTGIDLERLNVSVGQENTTSHKKTTMPNPHFLQEVLTTLSSSLTPTLTTTLIILTILYLLILSPHPTTPSFSLDYTLHILSFLFPPLWAINALFSSYTLCLLALSKPLSLTPVIVVVWYTALYTLTTLNTRLGNGAARRIVWRDQIAVITGGAGGLGWLMAKILELRGATVVVWDIKAPDEWVEDEDEEGVKWYKVDVGNAAEVEKAYEKVVDDVRSRLFFSLLYLTILFISVLSHLKHLKKVIHVEVNILTTLSSTGRYTHNPDQQRRNRKRKTPALPLSLSNLSLLFHQHTLPFPHLSLLSPCYAVLSSRRHNRYCQLGIGSSRRFTPNRLYRIQSRSSRLPHLPAL